MKYLYMTLALMMSLCAEEFKAELFKTAKLVYANDFTKEGDLTFFSHRNNLKVQDGKLIVPPYKAGGHIVLNMGKIPKKFVAQIRFKFHANPKDPGRPRLQIGHHSMLLTYLEGGGYNLQLANEGSLLSVPQAKMKVNEWVDLKMECQDGKMLFIINGFKKLIEDKNVIFHNPKDKTGPRFTFKHTISPESLLEIDDIKIWNVTE